MSYNITLMHIHIGELCLIIYIEKDNILTYDAYLRGRRTYKSGW